MARPGARFISSFVKNRNATEESCPPLQWHFGKKDNGKAGVSWKKLSPVDVFRQWIEDGLTSATDMAAEMGLSNGQISKLAKRDMAAGWLKKDGRDYAMA